MSDLSATLPLGRLRSVWRFVRTARDNSIATYGPDAFDRDYIERQLLWRRILIVNAPDGVKHVLVDNADNYTKSDLARRLLEPGLGRGLLTSEGETWRHHRRAMTPAFRQIARYAPIVTDATEAILADWDRRTSDAPLEVTGEMMRLTLAIIARAMFSFDTEADVAAIDASVTAYQLGVRLGFLDLVGLPGWLPRPSARRANRALRGIDEVIGRLLQRRLPPSADPDDLLTILLAAHDAGELTPREVRDEVVTVFTAGHETTAQAVSWAWYLLARHPEAEAALHDELRSALSGRTPGFDDLASLPYTRMVIEEAMRLYPPAHTMSRQAIADDVVGGHAVPAGSTVLIVPWVLHRHRRWWDDPERFDPERFTAERSAGRPRFVYLPFGAGPRICIGASFAMMEAVLVLATVAQRYRLTLAPGQTVEPIGLITLRPRHGMTMQLKRRQ
ncbi:MAG: cytochrome [Rhodospirillales bacterium]|nr:cytochrome [Rhodospirillales bacterium]